MTTEAPRAPRSLVGAPHLLATLDLELATAQGRPFDAGTADLMVAEVLVRRGLYKDAADVLPRRPPSSAPTAHRTR